MDIDIANDWGDGTYKESLKKHIKTAIEQWENDRRNSWLRPEVPENIQKAIDDLCKAFSGHFLALACTYGHKKSA